MCIQTCAWCGKQVHTRKDLDTDEKTVCQECTERIVNDVLRNKSLLEKEVNK